MKILALEFSSDQRSVAVACGPGHVREVIETARGRSMQPLGMVDSALDAAGVSKQDIECIAIGRGPGSYAGIRAAIALAQGWQLARPVRLLGISSVDCMARQARQEGLRGRVHVVVDAQRGEFYLADWELADEDATELAPLRIVGRAEVESLTGQGGLVLGPEATKWFAGATLIHPRAAVLAMLAASRADEATAGMLEPIYLRETCFVKAPPPRMV